MKEQTIYNVVQVLFSDGGSHVTADVIASTPTLNMAYNLLNNRIYYFEHDYDQNWRYDGHRYNAFFLIDDTYNRKIQLSVEPSTLISVF